MKMGRTAFEVWCRDACAYIRFTPDRPRVAKELGDHMEDRMEAFLAQGMAEDEAERLTLAAMGSPEETGRALNRVHKPYWGWVWQGTRLLAWLSVFVFVVCLAQIKVGAYPGVQLPLLERVEDHFVPQMPTWSEGGDGTYVLAAQWKPRDVTALCRGYRFSVTRAYVAVRRDNPGEAGEYELHLLIRATKPLPWAGYPSGLAENLSAVDDLGRSADSEGGEGGMLHQGSYGGNRLNWCWIEMVLYSFDPDADWVELCYQRLGQKVCLRVELPVWEAPMGDGGAA